MRWASRSSPSPGRCVNSTALSTAGSTPSVDPSDWVSDVFNSSLIAGRLHGCDAREAGTDRRQPRVDVRRRRRERSHGVRLVQEQVGQFFDRASARRRCRRTDRGNARCPPGCRIAGACVSGATPVILISRSVSLTLTFQRLREEATRYNSDTFARLSATCPLRVLRQHLLTEQQQVVGGQPRGALDVGGVVRLHRVGRRVSTVRFGQPGTQAGVGWTS